MNSRSNFNKNRQRKTNFNKNSVMVKFSNIPDDLEQHELRHLVYEWGPSGIGKVFVVKRDWGIRYGMVEFTKESEADYAVLALNKTKFGENLIINVDKLPRRF